MHFADDNWGLVWAALVALLAAGLAIARQIEQRPREKDQFSIRGAVTHPGRTFVSLLRLPVFWGALLLFCALLPLAATFPPGVRQRADPQIAELVRAAIADDPTVARLADSQQALLEEMRKPAPCQACRDDREPRGFPFGWSGLVGFLALFAGLWLIFEGWRPESPPPTGPEASPPSTPAPSESGGNAANP